MKVDVSDVLILAGVGLTEYGVYLLSQEWAIVTGGLILLAAGLIRANRR